MMTVDDAYGTSDEDFPIACFFKFILEPRLDLQKLEIPRKFMNNYGHELSKVIGLIMPTGKVWKFKLIKENGKTFLQNGWPEFVKFYSLSEQNVLVFKFVGNSSFEVVICDASASEIEYPIDDPQACKKSHPSKKRKTTNDDFINKPNTSTKKAKGVQDVIIDDNLILAHSVRFGGLTSEETKRVGAYFSCHCTHSSFAIRMKPTFVGPNFVMGIPGEFAKRHSYMYDGPCTFNLQTGTGLGATWKANTTCDSKGVKLSRGWKRVVSDNELKVGDICIFELIKKQEFKVHILRVANDAEPNRENPAVKIEVD